MRKILISSFGKSEEYHYRILNEMLIMDKTYKSKYKIDILENQVVEFLEFMTLSYENSQLMPSKDLFESNFPIIRGEFDNATGLVPIDNAKDYRVYVYNNINVRINKQVAKRVLAVNQEIEEKGITDELMTELKELQRLTNINKTKDIDIKIDFKKYYEEKSSRPIGMVFNMPCLDLKIGGLSPASLTTIAGFTSHFKSTLALNLVHNNVYYNGYNVIFLSLETSKEDVYTNLLCLHSYVLNPSRCILHDNIRNCVLSDDDYAYLFDEVEADWLNPVITVGGAAGSPKGKLVILDESDFRTKSFNEIYTVFEEIDDKLEGFLDCFVIDYIQLFKFGELGGSENSILNAYVAFFREMTQSFRDGDLEKKLIGVILSQINRESWKKARKSKGRYDLTCLADANELERGSHRVITTFTDDELRINKEANVQILKNRNGALLLDPTLVYADGEICFFGDDSSTFGSYSGTSSGLGDSFGISGYTKDLTS